ncbi:MAG: hypothetical protein WCE51_12095, partial [Chthoniobacterales bacterium]
MQRRALILPQFGRGQADLAARESMNLEMPLKIRLMPTKVPMTQTELDGHCRQIRIPRMRVMIPS